MAIHIGTATVKRAMIGFPNSLSRFELTGALLAIGLVPVHVLLHRLNPTNPTPPVFSIGPSQLDYEFVKVGLTVWPIMSWTLYSTLVASLMFHAIEGVAIMLRYWGRRLRGKILSYAEPDDGRRRSRWLAEKNIIASIGISTVLGGLAIIATEPLNISRAFMSRIEASFMLNPMFRHMRW